MNTRPELTRIPIDPDGNPLDSGPGVKKAHWQTDLSELDRAFLDVFHLRAYPASRWTRQLDADGNERRVKLRNWKRIHDELALINRKMVSLQEVPAGRCPILPREFVFERIARAKARLSHTPVTPEGLLAELQNPENINAWRNHYLHDEQARRQVEAEKPRRYESNVRKAR
jgi:hypothetical protein